MTSSSRILSHLGALPGVAEAICDVEIIPVPMTGPIDDGVEGDVLLTVMRGAPKDLSITTLRPFGPRVTFTASARMSTPRSMRARASPWNFTSFAAIVLFS